MTGIPENKVRFVYVCHITGYHKTHKSGKDMSKSEESARPGPRTGSLRVRAGLTAIESLGALSLADLQGLRPAGSASLEYERTVDSLRNPEEAVRFLWSVHDMKPAGPASPENGRTSESLGKPGEPVRHL